MSEKSTSSTTAEPIPEPYPTGFDHVEDITRPLREVAGGKYSRYQVFDDWVTLLLTSLAGDDEAYLDVVEKYDRDDLDQFIKAFGELMAASQRHQVDVLGDVYEDLGVGSDDFGQHFTPHPTSAAMAELQLAASDSHEDRPKISDPTCGSGRLLVATARLAPDGVFHGVDKDSVCARMAVVNLALFGLTGRIIHGDSLSMDYYRGWDVRGGRIEEIDAESLDELTRST